MCKLESRTSKRVDGDNFAFLEPKPDSGVELTLDCILARYLWHSLAMPAMAIMFFASVFPLRFPFLNLRVQNGGDRRRLSLESLEWRFRFRPLGGFH